jgi:monoterpene epsilon-lactone hydrolase
MPSFRARMTNAFLRLTTKSTWRPGLDIHEIRAHAARMEARLAKRALPVVREDLQIEGVPVTWFGPMESSARGTLLYLHGGAWCLHLPAVYQRLATTLSNLTGMRVLLVDYRLAPEHRFPAGPDDCLTVYRWLIEQGYGSRPLALAGDSAGGSLSLVTMMRARDLGLPLPHCAALLSPSTDLTVSGASARYNAEADPMFSPAASDLLPDVYCPGMDRSDPLLSPLFGNWAGLPPLLFHAGSTEMLLDDSIRAQDRARQAGVEAEIEVWRELPHVFQVFHWIPESRLALQAIADFITTRAISARPSLEQTAPAYSLEPALGDGITRQAL